MEIIFELEFNAHNHDFVWWPRMTFWENLIIIAAAYAPYGVLYANDR